MERPMAEKDEIHVTSSGGGSGIGLIAGILGVALLAFALIYFLGAFNGGPKTADINIEAPKIEAPKIDTPKVEAPKVDVPGVGEGR